MILQSFEDEFDLPSRRTLKIPSPDGDILVKVKPDEAMSEKYHKVY